MTMRIALRSLGAGLATERPGQPARSCRRDPRCARAALDSLRKQAAPRGGRSLALTTPVRPARVPHAGNRLFLVRLGAAEIARRLPRPFGCCEAPSHSMQRAGALRRAERGARFTLTTCAARVAAAQQAFGVDAPARAQRDADMRAHCAACMAAARCAARRARHSPAPRATESDRVGPAGAGRAASSPAGTRARGRRGNKPAHAAPGAQRTEPQPVQKEQERHERAAPTPRKRP